MEIKNLKNIRLTPTEDLFKLSALLSADSFFYGLYDNELSLIESSRIDISESSSISIPPFKAQSSCIGIWNDLFTIVPHTDHDEAVEYDVLSNAGNLKLKSSFDDLPNINARLYYKMHVEQYRFLEGNFENATRVHLISALVRNMFLENTGPTILVAKIEDKLVMIVFDNAKFLMANTFQPADDISVLYFLQLICHQYGLQKQRMSIELLGAFSDQERTKSFLDSFFYKVSFAKDVNSTTHSNPYSVILKTVLRCAS